MFSLSSDLRLPGTRLPFVQYLVSLALVRAARKEVGKESGGGSSGGSGAEGERAAAETAAVAAAAAAAAADSIRIKWPNDLYAGGGKLAGVLCHSSYVSSTSTSTSLSSTPSASAGGGNGSSNSAGTQSSCFRLTAGVGINVTNEPPPGASSLAGLLLLPPEGKDGIAPPPPPSSNPLSRETLLASALSELEPLLDALSSPAGFSEELRRGYEAAWLHSGQEVEVEEGVEMVSDSSSSKASLLSSRCRVKITGLSPSGFLAAVDAGDGLTRYELHPDGNSLDFFRGLVRKKAGPPPRA